MIRILGTAFAALMGLAFGSFLNVCLTRWPAGESIVKPRSHCRNCGRTLAWWENVPLLSWLALRGRCRTCGAWIGWRYAVVEAAIAGLWAYEFWWYLGPSDLGDLPMDTFPGVLLIASGWAIFLLIMVALAFLDAESYWLPNWLTLPGIVCGFVFNVAQAYESDRETTIGIGTGGAVVLELYSILLAAALILLIRWIYKLIRHREGLGLGDAKLMAMLAAWLGLPGALLSFAIGVVLGSLVAIVLLVRHPKHITNETWAAVKLPLGTFLCIGGIVSSLWGQPIIAVYMRWAGF
jgi:leader peptidase (prepilin peptidase) / N-methyltransferase